MSLFIKYTNSPPKKVQHKVIDILSRAFGDNINSSSTKNAFFTGFQSSYPNFVLLYKGDVLVGLAIIAIRHINLFNNLIKAITVGPIAIDPLFQKKGYSRYLMRGIDEIAHKLNAELIYLSGIRNFYQQYGYYTCLSKSKLIINSEDIESYIEVSYVPFSDYYLEDIKKIYKHSANQNTCTSSRSDEDWLWLTKYAKDSLHFFSPKIIVYNGNVIGYFCTDPHDQGRIREAIYKIDYKLIPLYLSGIKKYALEKKLESVEIMTPFESPLYKYMKKESTSTFVQFIKQRGGQILKIVDLNSFLNKISGFFKSDYCTVSLQISSEFICFNFNEFGTTKSSQSLLCAKNHFPGLITGYYNEEVLDGFDNLTNAMKIAYSNIFLKKIPFIYQGDNY